MHQGIVIHTPVRTMLHTWHADMYPVIAEISGCMRDRYHTRHFMATQQFRNRFLTDQTDETCLPWGPDNEIDNRITTHVAQEDCRVPGRRRPPLDGV